MPFDAGTVVEPLEYDFSTLPKRPTVLAKAKGIIDEPSDQMIGDFLKAQKALVTGASEKFKAIADLGDDPDPAAILQALADLDGDDVVNLMADMAALFSTLCGGNPSVNQLLALPLRVRIAFYAWIMEEVVRPEARPAAGKAQVISLPSAARG